MPFAILCWLSIALIVGIIRGLSNEESFVIDFRHGFRMVLAAPFFLITLILYIAAKVVYAIYDLVLTIAELIAGDLD